MACGLLKSGCPPPAPEGGDKGKGMTGMRLLLVYGLLLWVAVSLPVALFVGCVCSLRDRCPGPYTSQDALLRGLGELQMP